MAAFPPRFRHSGEGRHKPRGIADRLQRLGRAQYCGRKDREDAELVRSGRGMHLIEGRAPLGEASCEYVLAGERQSTGLRYKFVTTASAELSIHDYT